MLGLLGNSKQQYRNMKRAFLFSGGITAIIVGVFALAYLTSAGVSQFVFTGRGIVREHDTNGKIMKVYFNQLSTKAEPLALGTVVNVSVGNATFEKKASDGTFRRIRQGNLGIGDEVSIRGTVRNNERFVASKVIAVDTTFVMTGILRTFSNAAKEMTIEVKSSNFKSSRYVGNTPRFIFSTATKFYTRGKSKSLDDVTASDQKVRVEGKVVNGTELEVTSMNENVP